MEHGFPGFLLDGQFFMGLRGQRSYISIKVKCQKDSPNTAGTCNELSRFVNRCIIFEVTGELEKFTLAQFLTFGANLFLKRKYQVFCIL